MATGVHFYSVYTLDGIIACSLSGLTSCWVSDELLFLQTGWRASFDGTMRRIGRLEMHFSQNNTQQWLYSVSVLASCLSCL